MFLARTGGSWGWDMKNKANFAFENCLCAKIGQCRGEEVAKRTNTVAARHKSDCWAADEMAYPGDVYFQFIREAFAGQRTVAQSSKSGAADCLEALGVNIDLSPEKCVELLKKVGICFFFAQKYHTSMKYVGAIRKELGIRTVFNILGPLTNPAIPNMQLLGVYDESLVEPLARVLTSLGVKRGMVVYGTDRLDEISASSPTLICEFKDGEYQTYTITPEEFGMKTCKKDDLLGGTPAENAEITRAILKGEDKGPRRNAVLLNAGAALYIGDRAESFADGIRLAGELIDSGKALETLEAFIKESNS